jgi:hypothetical protein
VEGDQRGKSEMETTTTPWEITSRRELRDEIDALIKRLRGLLASERDEESSGLLIARLGEVHERLGGLVESAREWLAAPPSDAAATLIAGIKQSFDDVDGQLSEAAAFYDVSAQEIASYVGRGCCRGVEAAIWQAAKERGATTAADEEEEE